MSTDDHRSKSRPGSTGAGSPKGGGRKEGGGSSQGIVRDQRGQEQPADKERAQRATKTDQFPRRG